MILDVSAGLNVSTAEIRAILLIATNSIGDLVGQLQKD